MFMLVIVGEMGTKNVDPQQRYSLGDMLGQGYVITNHIRIFYMLPLIYWALWDLEEWTLPFACLSPTLGSQPQFLTSHSYSPHNELSPRRLFQHMMPDFT